MKWKRALILVSVLSLLTQLLGCSSGSLAEELTTGTMALSSSGSESTSSSSIGTALPSAKIIDSSIVTGEEGFSLSLAVTTEEDQSARYVCAITDRAIIYDSFEKLAPNSLGIVTGTVISSEPYWYSQSLHTLSKLQIDSVYSGSFQPGEVILVSQFGGTVTEKEHREGIGNGHLPVDKSKASPDDGTLIAGIDGYFPVPVNQKVLLFLQDPDLVLEGVDQKIYSSLGGYDGTFYQGNDLTTYIKPLPYGWNSVETYSLSDSCLHGGALTISLEQVEAYVKELASYKADDTLSVD